MITLARAIGDFGSYLADERRFSPRDGPRLPARTSTGSPTFWEREFGEAAARRRRRCTKIDTLSVRSHLASLHRAKLANRSLARHLSTLRSFFRWACREGHLEHNPAKGLPSPRVPRSAAARADARRTRRRSSRRRTRDTLPERERALFELLYATGLRVSEAAALDVEDVDLSARMLRAQGKGRKERIVPFGEKAEDALRA